MRAHRNKAQKSAPPPAEPIERPAWSAATFSTQKLSIAIRRCRSWGTNRGVIVRDFQGYWGAGGDAFSAEKTAWGGTG